MNESGSASTARGSGSLRDTKNWRTIAWAALIAGILAVVSEVLTVGFLLAAGVPEDSFGRGVAMFVSSSSLPVAIAGLVLGIVGLRSVLRRQAIAGIVLSGLAIVAIPLMVVFGEVFWA